MLNNLRSEQRQQQTLPAPMPRAPTPRLSTHAPVPPRAIHFVVRRIRFVGAVRRHRAALRQLVAPYLNRSIDFATLQQLVDLVAEHYRSDGLLVHVLLPAQDITAGVVTLRIVPARLGLVRVQGAPVGDERRIANWIYRQVASGAPIATPALERGLLLLGDLPEFAVSGSLVRGSQLGLTDFDVEVSPKPAVLGAVSLDDYGNGSTGVARLSAQLGVDGVLGFGTRLGLSAMHSSGSDFLQLELGLPVRNDGWRFGADASRMQYRVRGSSFQALAISGSTTSAGLHLRYPLLRSRPANVYVRLRGEFNAIRSANATGSVADQSYDTRVAHATLDANWLGTGLNSASLRLSAGDIGRAASGSFNREYGVAGGFAKLHYAYAYTRSLVDGLSGHVALSGQFANRNLDSSEQMYLGGPYAVRGYASGQLPATQGALLSLQLSRALPRRAQAELFYDVGAVRTWKSNPAVNTYSNHYTVQDVGLGLSWRGPHHSSLTASWAHNVGPLKPSVASYLKLNGGLARNRVWLMASLPFDA